MTGISSRILSIGYCLRLFRNSGPIFMSNSSGSQSGRHRPFVGGRYNKGGGENKAGDGESLSENNFVTKE